jgi:hypothetical protein
MKLSALLLIKRGNNMRLHRLFLLVLLMLPIASYSAQAADKKPVPANLEPLPEALPPPGVIEANPADAPEITIVKKGETKVEEYRMHGELYMQKITPPHGTPYYLMKQEQEGGWSRFDGPAAPLVIPKWVIFRF